MFLKDGNHLSGVSLHVGVLSVLSFEPEGSDSMLVGDNLIFGKPPVKGCTLQVNQLYDGLNFSRINALGDRNTGLGSQLCELLVGIRVVLDQSLRELFDATFGLLGFPLFDLRELRSYLRPAAIVKNCSSALLKDAARAVSAQASIAMPASG